MINDPDAFIRANTALLPVPHTPEIRIHVAAEATDLWEKTEEELGELGLPPPYWAFCWAGGQALARYVLDRPDLVRGKRVLDLAAGSGLVGIAAAMGGAAHVESAEIDAFAVAAIRLNAAANAVPVLAIAEDLLGEPHLGRWDVILAGDVCYERAMTSRVIDWLTPQVLNGVTVLLGDPGRNYLPKDRLEWLEEYRVPTTRALEDAEIKRTAVWSLKA